MSIQHYPEAHSSRSSIQTSGSFDMCGNRSSPLACDRLRSAAQDIAQLSKKFRLAGGATSKVPSKAGKTPKTPLPPIVVGPKVPTELEYSAMAGYTKLTAANARELFKNGLIVKGVPMLGGGTMDLNFTATIVNGVYKLQAMDQVEATVCGDEETPPCTERRTFTYNIVKIELEPLVLDSKAINYNQKAGKGALTAAAAAEKLAALQKAKQDKADGKADYDKTYELDWCHVAEIGPFFANPEPPPSSVRFKGADMVALAVKLCEYSGYSRQYLEDGSQFKSSCTHEVNGMKQTDVFSHST